eukprot:CAMPEP_0115005964 /NCGR_PEP_ID=MMETSP0216-20121206/20202_1 /TAXON_ID=223996 /ORGANISM="Protocruzia adherens, Strain Boccale" /LENGTH=220 /DNA_ID=CAMNT_0002372425 /DNA_START=459 /DNA_END=1121 /DNA_ORIENTATION=+
MSELFHSYDEDCQTFLGNVQSAIGGFKSSSLQEKASTLKKIKSDLSEAEKCIKQMEIEISMLAPKTRGQLNPKIKGYKSQLNDYKGTYDRMSDGFQRQQNRDALMGSGGAAQTSNDPREKLLQNQGMLDDQEDRLVDSKKAAYQSEDIAVNVLTELKHQRNVINRAHANNQEVDHNLHKSDRVIRTMGRRTLVNKLILWVLIILLFAADIIVLIVKLKKK